MISWAYLFLCTHNLTPYGSPHFRHCNAVFSCFYSEQITDLKRDAHFFVQKCSPCSGLVLNRPGSLNLCTSGFTPPLKMLNSLLLEILKNWSYKEKYGFPNATLTKSQGIGFFSGFKPVFISSFVISLTSGIFLLLMSSFSSLF